MGGEQAAGVLATITQEQRRREGKEVIFSEVHGKMFLESIISNNLWTLKAVTCQTAKHLFYACTSF